MTKLKQISYLVFLVVFAIGCTSNASPPEKKQAADVALKEGEARKEVKNKIIVFFGNSLTAGYGLEENESFPSLIQNRLDSLEMDYTIVNAGLSGETTAGGRNRVEWILKQEMDVFVLELGANDMLRGFDLRATEDNLEAIIQKVRSKHNDIPILLAGMFAPPNLGKEYTEAFASIFPRLAKKHNVRLIPFLLDGVAGEVELNLKDGIHPNAKGQYKIRDNVWSVLKDVL